MNVLIRNADISDAEQIASVHYRTWIETYRGILPESYLAKRSVEKSTALFRANHCSNIVVAELDRQIIGFCGFGKLREPVQYKSIGEIQGIYLLDAYKRNHIGQKLLECALEFLKKDNFTNAGLWVLAGNKGAVAFYERLGFTFSGISKEVNLVEQITELFYIRKI